MISALLILIIPFAEAKFYEANTTDLSKCKIHYSRSDGVYKTFYELSEEARSNGSLLDFHFAVLAPSDAHIVFTTSTELAKSDSLYEIVLGAGGNMFSDIRRAQKSEVKASVPIKNILSSLDPRSFWIHVSKDGLIEIGREGEELAFLSWKDPNPLSLKFFSFGTWPGVEAKWFFDCIANNGSEEVKKVLTDLQRLRQDLLTYYDPYVRPVLNASKMTELTMQLPLSYITLDEHRSTLEVRGTMKLEWIDEKMKWNPENYGNITDMHIVGRQIWQPDFVVINSVDAVGRDAVGDSLMLVSYNGAVQWTPPTHIKVWCDSSDLGHWPSDVHACQILLGFSTDPDFLLLQFNETASNTFGTLFETQWKILEITVITFFEEQDSELIDLQNRNVPFLNLNFKMQRISRVYDVVFFAPFLVVAVSMLATFWVSPFGFLKIALGCFQLIVNAVVLINLASAIPSHSNKVPYLVLLYSYGIIASMVCILISAIVINLSRCPYKNAVQRHFWKFITSFPVRTLLLLPSVQSLENYGKLGDNQVKQDMTIQSTWILLGTFVDRISFIIFTILLAYLLSLKY